ncbi:MAG: hypothetical protein MK081_03280 [Flavobacteriales bacterium]|nr:hypothetical protein [Flavobacteriales bacterium]
MGKILLLVTSLFCSAGLSAQQDHDWLIALFGEEDYATVAENAPEKIEYYTFADEHGYLVQMAEGKDLSGYPDALTIAPKKDGMVPLSVDLILSDEFHPSLYRFKTTMNDTHWYRVGDTDYVITVLPLTSVQNKFNSEE